MLIKKEIKEQKRKYAKPVINQIKIDNEITLVMQSTPPPDPEGSAPNFISNGALNPFKIDF